MRTKLRSGIPRMTPKLAEICTSIRCFAKGVRGSNDCRHHWQPERGRGVDCIRQSPHPSRKRPLADCARWR